MELGYGWNIMKESRFEVPYEMRHGAEPLRRSSGGYKGNFELILVMG